MKIINIGDELLIGQVINTNASWMSSELNKANFDVESVIVIGDNEAQIRKTIETELPTTDFIIMTGGLGPTKDDITKKVICDYFGTSLEIDNKSLEIITQMWYERGIEVSEINRLQAAVPINCTVLHNYLGTAPGIWMEQNGHILIALPGVPFEMKGLMTDKVIPLLREKFAQEQVIIHRVVQTTGIGESTLADLIAPWENQLPDHIKLAYLPQPGIVRLRLTAHGNNQAILNQELDQQIAQLDQIADNYIFSHEDNKIQEVVFQLLDKKKKTLTLAESCTGGYIAHLITSMPGSSRFFKGSIVSYSNEIKREILNVRENNLKKFGAVSEFVVNDMAINSMDLFDVDYSVAVSGVAGPSGGSPEKPVGTVWIAVASNTRITTQKFSFSHVGGRARIIERAAIAALNMLRIELLKD